jgi:uncharacterized protein (DUF302 family)
MRAKLLLMFSILLIVTTSAAADKGLVVKPSAYGVDETLDRLEEVLKKKGLTIFARIDHSAGAAKVQLNLRPTQVLIFGNPKMGTALMQSSQTVGIDLPMKVLAWKDEAGKAWIAYNDPSYLADRHQINDRGEVLQKMTGALAKLTDKATSKP